MLAPRDKDLPAAYFTLQGILYIEAYPYPTVMDLCESLPHCLLPWSPSRLNEMIIVPWDGHFDASPLKCTVSQWIFYEQNGINLLAHKLIRLQRQPSFLPNPKRQLQYLFQVEV